MILTGREIASQIGKNIRIQPFNKNRLNSNSYNLRLHNKLLVYSKSSLDMKEKNPTREIVIPPTGVILEPGILYLGRTLEYTETHNLVPMLEGRSSIGRLGMFVHVTAGFGDTGFCGYWTLEIQVIHPLRIYSDVEVCQIFYHTVKGSIDPYRSQKYQKNKGVQPSLLYKDFQDPETIKGSDRNFSYLPFTRIFL